MTLTLKTISTPLGEIVVGCSQEGICFLEFLDSGRIEKHIEQLDIKVLKGSTKILESLEHQLTAYFNNKLKNFTLPLYPIGTDFQIKTWKTLLKIPYGSTLSYKEQSLKMGSINLTRSVASANGKNRIAILIPCHRVIGNNGNLTGYSGGIWRKRFLLELESDQKKLF